MEFFAPAKVNLTLRVLGRRLDGYHELESVMQALSLADRLIIEPGKKLIFACSDPVLATPDNLVLRTARLLQQYGLHQQGANIYLEKYIPVQAGLGGGSSDAATALRALNSMWDMNLPSQTLAELGASIGSDVPFFLDGPTAVVRGRGERIQPVKHVMHCAIVLVKPAVGLSTPQVYADLRASSLPTEVCLANTKETAAMMHALGSGDPLAVADALVNDLETPAIRLLPELNELRIYMKDLGCLGVLLCGSGSALFGICPSIEIAQVVADCLYAQNLWTWAGFWAVSE